MFKLLNKYIYRVIKSRTLRWAGHVAYMGKKRNVYRNMIGSRGGKRSLKHPSHRWEGDIETRL
jgi:hypothetical protein